MTDPTPANAALVRQEFGGTTAMTGIEMQAQALAAQAKAAVEARYILAMRRPRDLNTVRIRLKEECKRPSFAEEARYVIPRGEDHITGPSIRFAEAAARAMTNIMPETIVVYDGPQTRQLRVSVTDLEANLTYSQDIILAKTMERRTVRKGQTSLGQRYNTYGDLVHIVEATDDELNLRQAALVSKNIRTLILRLVPGDIIEECMGLCVQILKDQHAKDPRESIKAICDGFAERGVMPDDLVRYLGKPLEQATAAEVTHLRSLWAALRDGQTTWDEALERKLEGKPVVATPAPNVKKLDSDKNPPIATGSAAVVAEAIGAAIVKDQAQGASSSPQSAPAAAPPPEQGASAPAQQGGAQRAQQAKPKGGTKAVTQQVKDAKAKAAQETLAAPPTPGPGSPEWEAAKERAANKPAPLAAVPPPAPQPDPHGDPPPPDDVPLPKDEAPPAPPHPAGDPPDWMA